MIPSAFDSLNRTGTMTLAFVSAKYLGKHLTWMHVCIARVTRVEFFRAKFIIVA